MSNGKGHEDPQPNHGNDDKGHHPRPIPPAPSSSGGTTERK